MGVSGENRVLQFGSTEWREQQEEAKQVLSLGLLGTERPAGKRRRRRSHRWVNRCLAGVNNPKQTTVYIKINDLQKNDIGIQRRT